MKVTRRSMLKTGAVLGAAPLLYSPRTTAANFTNMPDAESVKLGFMIAESGPFADEGAEELRAFQLAVEHINGVGDGGMINTMQPTRLQGNGILGRRVEYVVADTETRPSVATENASALIENEGVTMLSGGSSTGVAVALQGLSQERGIVFMAGLTHANDTTGVGGVKNGFRHHVNARMSSRALATHLVDKYAEPRKVYYLVADFNWGYQNQAGFSEVFESNGWETVATVATPLSETDFTSFISPVIESGADTLMMCQYGANMVNMLAAIDRLGLKDLQVNGKPFIVGLPLYSDLMVRGAATLIDGVYGTANWHASFTDSASEAFKASYSSRYNRAPSGAAHTCYVQTLLYADACERAGTFDPCRVVAALQDHQFSGLGNGSCFYRAADHQCFKDVPIMKGRADAGSIPELLVVDGVVPRSSVEYSAESSNADHGQCFNGVDLVTVNETSGNIVEGINPGGSSTDIETETSGSSGGGSIALAGLAAVGAGLIARRTNISAVRKSPKIAE